MIYKCWLGKPNYFDIEIQYLIKLIKNSIQLNLASLILSTDPSDGDWIGSDHYSSIASNIEKGQICLLTSGTTGEPKQIWKKLSDEFSNKKGNGSFKDKWLLTYSPVRWAGISVILHALKTNAQLIVPNNLTPNAILNCIDKSTHISLTPSLFRKLLMYGYQELKCANISQITFGGEYATQKIIDDAKDIWPNAKISHIYATTEFGDICACSDGYEGLPLNKIKIPFKLNDNGELFLNNKSTQDLWEIKNNRLYYIGRESEIINIGGAKISESIIEKFTNDISYIKECKAYPIPNALLGQVVGLDYVGEISPIEVKKHLLKCLPKYGVPVKLNKVDEINITSAGKIDRK